MIAWISPTIVNPVSHSAGFPGFQQLSARQIRGCPATMSVSKMFQAQSLGAELLGTVRRSWGTSYNDELFNGDSLGGTTS